MDFRPNLLEAVERSPLHVQKPNCQQIRQTPLLQQKPQRLQGRHLEQETETKAGATKEYATISWDLG